MKDEKNENSDFINWEYFKTAVQLSESDNNVYMYLQMEYCRLVNQKLTNLINLILQLIYSGPLNIVIVDDGF